MMQNEMSPVTPAPSRKEQYTMLGTGLTVLLILFLLWSIYIPVADFLRVKHISTDGQKGQAYVDSVEIRTGYRSSRTVATYHYTVRLQDGTTRQFTRTDDIKQDTKAALREKTQADIFYLPEDPQEAILALEVFDTPLDYFALIGQPLLFMIILILMVMLGNFLNNNPRYQKWLETQKTPKV